MIVGVGIALSIGMTILAVISAEMDLLTGDYERSGIGVYVATQGGKIVASLAGDTPGHDPERQHGAGPGAQLARGADRDRRADLDDGARSRRARGAAAS